MDVLYFLRNRTHFLRFYYDEAVRGFVEVKRKIEDQEAPFDPPAYWGEDEPPFLEEWMNANTAVNLVGLSAVSHLSETLKLYFGTLQDRVIGFTITNPKAFQHGFVPVYRSVLGNILDTDWSDCPADFAVIEQIVLARNSGHHGTWIGSFDVPYTRHTLSKHPKPIFVEDNFDHASQPVTSITVTRTNLFEALQHVEQLAEWIDGRLDKAWEWRSRG